MSVPASLNSTCKRGYSKKWSVKCYFDALYVCQNEVTYLVCQNQTAEKSTYVLMPWWGKQAT